MLKKCAIVADVGGVFDASTNLFDHHQNTFIETARSLSAGSLPFDTKLSSAGLIYVHFGKRVIEHLTNTAAQFFRQSCHGDVSGSKKPPIEELYRKMYENFVEEVDAVDNGISQFGNNLQPLYKMTTSLSSRVSSLNPPWNYDDLAEDNCAIFDERSGFIEALHLVGNEFVERLLYFERSWLPARRIVINALSIRHEVDASGEIIYLKQFGPWKEHLFELESQQDETCSIKYVLYRDGNSNYRVQAVPVSSGSFASRLPLPEAWRGLRDTQLDAASGSSVVDGAVFVHASGFIGGHSSFEGALQMAKASLDQPR